ncbi:MAG TPA: DUF6504 family protein [Marmoricola sp.]|nr:DUF6504 family protein [Marmoricola sp.]
MRLYDDLVEVRKGPIGGGAPAEDAPEGPQQFLWRGRLWQVREVVAHWVETGAWWLRGPAEEPGVGTGSTSLLREREVWRVTASRGRAVGAVGDPGFGVFDLTFDWACGDWRLARTAD